MTPQEKVLQVLSYLRAEYNARRLTQAEAVRMMDKEFALQEKQFVNNLARGYGVSKAKELFNKSNDPGRFLNAIVPWLEEDIGRQEAAAEARRERMGRVRQDFTFEEAVGDRLREASAFEDYDEENPLGLPPARHIESDLSASAPEFRSVGMGMMGVHRPWFP